MNTVTLGRSVKQTPVEALSNSGFVELLGVPTRRNPRQNSKTLTLGVESGNARYSHSLAGFG